MSPFTLFLARLVALVGAENAAQMVREFAGKTIQFPITDHYGEKQLAGRRVSTRMTIEYMGAEYDVSGLPEAVIGKVITVCPDELPLIRHDQYGFPINARVISGKHIPLSEAEAIEISHRLLATVRLCSSATQSEPSPDAETPMKGANYTAHPNPHTVHQCTTGSAPPDNEQVPHRQPA